MKILTITTTFPYPPDDGTKIQIYERVRELSARHDVTLLSVCNECISFDRRREMDRFCKCVCLTTVPQSPRNNNISRLYNLIRSLWLREPYYIHDAICREVQSWLACESNSGFDVLEADCYANAYLRGPFPALKVAIFHSVSDTCTQRRSTLAKSYIQRGSLNVYKTLTNWYEASIVRSVDLSVTLTEDSRREFQHLHPSARVQNCLSNGVDAEYFAYNPVAGSPTGACFVGKMDYLPNTDAAVWFGTKVLPLIRRDLPDFRFSIIGGNAPDIVTDLGRKPGIDVTGYVEDVRPYLRAFPITVVPMRMGGGILNKLLQSMAIGVPVVATRLSLEGLSVVPGRELLLADTPEDFAQGVIRVAGDGVLRARLTSNARQYVEAKHEWGTMVRSYEAALQACLAERLPKIAPSASLKNRPYDA